MQTERNLASVLLHLCRWKERKKDHALALALGYIFMENWKYAHFTLRIFTHYQKSKHSTPLIQIRELNSDSIQLPLIETAINNLTETF